MSASVLDFAQQLETDIRQRCLAPGHKYLTAQESAELLGTSVATANRALRILAEREVVVRRRNSGTFVGAAVHGVAAKEVQTVSILAPDSLRGEDGPRFDLIINGILANFPDVGDVRISYVPAEGGVPFVMNLLEPLRNSGRLAGVIATSCPRDVYRYLGENGYPLVVWGSLYSDQPYPSIDADEHAAGKMLTTYLIERGHRRIALFSDSESCAGDNYFRDGVSEALTAANMPHNALIWRAPGNDPAVMRAQLNDVLSLPQRPTAVAAKLPKWADDIAALVEQRGLRVPQDVEIVFKGFAVGEAGKSAFPHVCPNIPQRQIAATLGQMLAAVRENVPLEKRSVVIPYEMRRSPGIGVVD
jgi:LacI family transcriptional regulator